MPNFFSFLRRGKPAGFAGALNPMQFQRHLPQVNLLTGSPESRMHNPSAGTPSPWAEDLHQRLQKTIGLQQNPVEENVTPSARRVEHRFGSPFQPTLPVYGGGAYPTQSSPYVGRPDNDAAFEAVRRSRALDDDPYPPSMN